MPPKQYKNVSLVIEPKQIELLDLLGEVTSANRSELVREAIQLYLDLNKATDLNTMRARAQEATEARLQQRVRRRGGIL